MVELTLIGLISCAFHLNKLSYLRVCLSPLLKHMLNTVKAPLYFNLAEYRLRFGQRLYFYLIRQLLKVPLKTCILLLHVLEFQSQHEN
jgi:hypothetical protein